MAFPCGAMERSERRPRVELLEPHMRFAREDVFPRDREPGMAPPRGLPSARSRAGDCPRCRNTPVTRTLERGRADLARPTMAAQFYGQDALTTPNLAHPDNNLAQPCGTPH